MWFVRMLEGFEADAASLVVWRRIVVAEDRNEYM
jgi:hypothetical protein